jgi:hypothetical protein
MIENSECRDMPSIELRTNDQCGNAIQFMPNPINSRRLSRICCISK